MTPLPAVLVVSSLSLLAAASPVGQAGGDAERDVEFVRQAVAAGREEIARGQIAGQRATHADVRAYAARVVEAHTTATAELLALAAPPSAAGTSDNAAAPANQSASFDAEYLAASAAAHDVMAALYAHEAAEGRDERLKLWAGQKLPELRAHGEAARTLAARLGPGGRR